MEKEIANLNWLKERFNLVTFDSKMLYVKSMHIYMLGKSNVPNDIFLSIYAPKIS